MVILNCPEDFTRECLIQIFRKQRKAQNAQTIRFLSPIKSIETETFHGTGFKYLEKVELPEGLEEIKDRVFKKNGK